MVPQYFGPSISPVLRGDRCLAPLIIDRHFTKKRLAQEWGRRVQAAGVPFLIPPSGDNLKAVLPRSRSAYSEDGKKNCRVQSTRDGLESRRRTLQRHRIREKIIEKHADQDQVGEEDERPAHIVPDDLAFAAYKLAGRNAHAGGLRRDRFAHFRPYRVEGRQHQDW